MGLLPVTPLPSANDPCLKWDFLLAPLAGMGVLPARPLPSANDPCLKWNFLLAPLPGMACCRSSPCPPQIKWDFLLAPVAGVGMLPVKPLPSANDPCLKKELLLARKWAFCLNLCLDGLLPGEALAIVERPLHDMKFLLAPLPGRGLLPGETLAVVTRPFHELRFLLAPPPCAWPKSVLQRPFPEMRFMLAPLQGCFGPPPRHHTKTLGTKP